MHGCLIDRQSDFMQFIEKATVQSGQTMPACYYSAMSLDAGYLMKNGVPAVMWGPGDPAQFHTSNESVAVDELIAAAKFYRALAGEI
jgi:acetylornithine deacetylase/succinyl-diaminopimelate desuccinylase-like protein